MNHINGQITVGAPHSKARYQNATRICESCLKTEPMPNYRTLVLSGVPIVTKGQCYVCEAQDVSVAHVMARE